APHADAPFSPLLVPHPGVIKATIGWVMGGVDEGVDDSSDESESEWMDGWMDGCWMAGWLDGWWWCVDDVDAYAQSYAAAGGISRKPVCVWCVLLFPFPRLTKSKKEREIHPY